VRDIIGVKIIVNTENEITQIISDLESFVGGSSTRKRQKDSYHRFGRKGLGEFSAKEYFVWKAVYDLTLPHPSLLQLEKIMTLTRRNKAAQEEISKRMRSFIDNPRDFVIEVQLQDIRSYLQSIAKGSPSEHAWLKMNQIRSNSFYKFFPQMIYGSSLADFKQKLLRNGKE